MVDVWPASLPQWFNLSSYAGGIGDGRIRSRTDTGPGKSRRRSSATPEPIKASTDMTGAQLDILRAFVNGTLLNGSLPFTMPNPEKDVGNTLMVRFAERLPTWQAKETDLWEVSLDLEVLP